MYLLQKSKWIETWTRQVVEALEARYWCFMVLKKIEYENRHLRRYFQNFSWGHRKEFYLLGQKISSLSKEWNSLVHPFGGRKELRRIRKLSKVRAKRENHKEPRVNWKNLGTESRNIITAGAEGSKEPLQDRLDLIIKPRQLNDTNQKQTGCLLNDKGQGLLNARKWRGAPSLSTVVTNPEVKIRHVYRLGKVWGRSGKDVMSLK